MGRVKVDTNTKERINNTDLLKDSGLRVVHIRPGTFFDGSFRKGITIAFEPTDKPVVRIATSLCKFGDTFCKKLGTRQAVENFRSGATIRVPYSKRRGVINSLKDMFTSV